MTQTNNLDTGAPEDLVVLSYELTGQWNVVAHSQRVETTPRTLIGHGVYDTKGREIQNSRVVTRATYQLMTVAQGRALRDADNWCALPLVRVGDPLVEYTASSGSCRGGKQYGPGHIRVISGNEQEALAGLDKKIEAAAVRARRKFAA